MLLVTIRYYHSLCKVSLWSYDHWFWSWNTDFVVFVSHCHDACLSDQILFQITPDNDDSAQFLAKDKGDSFTRTRDLPGQALHGCTTYNVCSCESFSCKVLLSEDHLTLAICKHCFFFSRMNSRDLCAKLYWIN